MKALSIINTALLILNEYDLHKYVNGNMVSESKFAQDKELLIKSLNEALYSVIDYYPITQTETLEPTNGKIEYSAFKNHVYKIVSVTDANGNPVSVKIHPTHMEATEQVCVTYKYYSVVNSINDEIPYDNTPITENTLAFGLISEFLVYKGRFNEALAYSDKFVEGLIKARRFLRRKTLKTREWY